MLLLACTAVFPPIMARAHGSGAYMEKVVGDYLIDIGYDEIAMREGNPVAFDFNISKQEQSQKVTYTDVWIQVASQNNETVFQGRIHKYIFGQPALILGFPQNGSYIITVRFENVEEILAEAIFPLAMNIAVRDTARNPQKSFLNSYEEAGIGTIFGFIIGSALVMLRKKFKGA